MPRITSSSLAVFCDKNRTSLEPPSAKVAAALLKEEDAYHVGTGRRCSWREPWRKCRAGFPPVN